MVAVNVCVVGCGYVGLVSGAGFAETGAVVRCVDVDEGRVMRLNRGEIPIFEPGLGEMVKRNVEVGRLSFSSDLDSAVRESTLVFLAVGTPPREDGSADLSAVFAAAASVAKAATQRTILVLKSTVPVGTNRRVREIVKNAPAPIHVVSNPEFLKEGDAVNDFLRPDRIVIGCEDGDEIARSTMTQLYHPLCLDKDRILWMDPASAELTKYVANAMLAMRISFMNEVAELCEKVGADIHRVRRGVGSDSRIGLQFLYAGPGYGGSCFPKDVAALAHSGREAEVYLELVHATAKVNDKQKQVLPRKIKASLGADLGGKRIAIWGLTFKPKTDDIRESPALSLIDALLDSGAEIVVHDPEGMPNVRAIYGERLRYASEAYEAARDADALVLTTEWRQYQQPDFPKLKKLMRNPRLFDGRNIWSEYGLHSQGFEYTGIGIRENQKNAQ